MIQRGDRVELLPTTQWVIGTNNPAIGTEWYCLGTVTSSTSREIDVDWDNGTFNAYQHHHGDIVLVNEDILV
ncbi:MAG: hypothetical protein ACRC6V_19265 [Bacteroidales bacterium]